MLYREQLCGKALYDLSASINFIPMSVFKQLGIRDVIPTIVTLQLAYHNCHFATCISVLCLSRRKNRKCISSGGQIHIPTDFIVLDYEADKEVPVILGRPFLATEKTLIDVQKKELTQRVVDEKVTFNVFMRSVTRM